VNNFHRRPRFGVLQHVLPEKSAGHAREPKTADAGELVLLEPGFFISMSIFGGGVIGRGEGHDVFARQKCVELYIED
jgi:hypothetical protein